MSIMYLNVNISNEAVPLRLNSFCVGTCSFICDVGLDATSTVSITYPFNVDSSFDYKLFSIFLFAKKNIRENDIFEVHDVCLGNRIGWCFPAQALSSNAHSYFDNEYFIKYAYVAYQLLLTGESNCRFIVNPDLTDEMNISDFFHDETVFLVISNQSIGFSGFDLISYTPSLLSYGYIPLIDRSPDNIIYLGTRIPNKKIKIRKMSNDVDNVDFIETLFSKLIGYENNPVLCFFYLYQVYELLIEQIFAKEKYTLLNDIIKNIEDTSEIKEIQRSLSDMVSEKSRLNLLLARYTEYRPSEDSLRDGCNELLIKLGKKSGNSMPDYLYQLRNYLVHQYRNFPENCHADLYDVVKELIVYTSEILCAFRYPTSQISFDI